MSSKSSSKKTIKQESFDSESEFVNKEENYHRSTEPPVDVKRFNDKYLRKFERRVNEDEFLEHFRSGKNMLDEAINVPSDSECSLDSTKVEIDSLCLEDDDYPPSMIQDFKYDFTSNRSDDTFTDLNLNAIGHKEDLVALSPGIMDNLSRIRTSTKKEDNCSVEANCSTENSLAGSSQDLSDDATISDSESLSKFRTSLNSKVFICVIIATSPCLEL